MEELKKVILPGSSIGILGGGQLGRMLTLSAKAMGYRVAVLDPSSDCPAAQVADTHVQSNYQDSKGANQLGRQADVITYEFENVDSTIVEKLEESNYLPQGSLLLKITNNRSNEKKILSSFGLPVAPYEILKQDPFSLVNNEPTTHIKLVSSDENHLENSLMKALEKLGMPVVMKTTTGGYDGKGQWVIRNERDFISASHVFNQPEYQDTDFIVEKFIPFEKEISVIVARNSRGEIETYPVSENIHVNNILHLSVVPARIPEEKQREAQEIARLIAQNLEIVGLLAVEMFYNQDGSLYINELAPRPHNSGHFTMDASETSQFEQHIRAICNLPLGKPDLLSPVVMANLLGQHMERFMEIIPRLPKEVKFHLYGKKQAVHNRKMGHINVLSSSVEDAFAIIDQLSLYDDRKY